MTNYDPDVADKARLRDNLTSIVRTAVPVGWGVLLTFLLARFPLVHDLVDTPYWFGVADAAATTAWYSLWRVTERHIPPWLTRILLGSNSAPTYRAPLAA